MDALSHITIEKHLLSFSFPAGTSRGTMMEKKLWIVRYNRGGRTGLGECSIIEGLSPDYVDEISYENQLNEYASLLQLKSESPETALHALTDWFPDLCEQPSIRCGFEMALLDWLCPVDEVVFDNAFARGAASIPINGLIWMGEVSWMEQQVKQKIAAGFRVLKFKIAALDWDQEWDFLQAIRSRYSEKELVIRADANGGFKEEEVISRLKQLSSLNIHSIEQPVAPKNVELLHELSKLNLVPIALDESLISCYTLESKRRLLTHIKPQFIVLKPSLHGGFSGVQEWIDLANELEIGWWITSALESNLGLRAIAQFTANYDITSAHGLGTGGLYTTNFATNLQLKGPKLFHYLPEQGEISSQVE